MHHIKALRGSECFRFLHMRPASQRMKWAFHSAVMKGGAVTSCLCAEKVQDEIRHMSHNLKKITTLVDSGSYCLKEMSPDSKYTPFFWQVLVSGCVIPCCSDQPKFHACVRDSLFFFVNREYIIYYKRALNLPNTWDISCYIGISWQMWGSWVMSALFWHFLTVAEKETTKPLSSITQRKTTPNQVL